MLGAPITNSLSLDLEGLILGAFSVVVVVVVVVVNVVVVVVVVVPTFEIQRPRQ